MMSPMRSERAPFLALLLALLSACGSNAGDDDAGIADGSSAASGPVWTLEPGVPTQEDLLGVWGRGIDDVFAVGFHGTILHYDGMVWSKEVTTATVPLSSIHGLPLPTDRTKPAGPIFAVGWSATLITRNADASWSNAYATSTVTEDLFDVFVGSDKSALAVGSAGRLLGFDGATWRIVRMRIPSVISGLFLEPKTDLKGVWSQGGQRYFISGSQAGAYRSDSNLTRFEAFDVAGEAQLNTNPPFRGIWGVQGGPVYAVGLDALILRYDGRWRQLSSDGVEDLPRAFLFDVHGRSGNDITIVGWRGVAIHFDGARWTREITGVTTDLRSVWVDDTTGTAFAVGASGTILRRTPPPIPDAGL